MTFNNENITERLVDYTLELDYQSLPPEVLDRTKQLFLDFLGVAVGGRDLAESSAPILQGVKDIMGGERGRCTVIGESARFPAHYAALLNATFAHSMDFDDTHREAIMHPGAPIFSTLMALAEETEATGPEFMTAAVAAYDVANKVNRAIGRGQGIHKRGFHATATTGIFAATMAGARLKGLSRDQTLNAVGLNISQAAGSQQFLENGAWTKRLHVGLAAHNAIYALIMARRGFLGATQPIEGRYGYIANYSHDGWDPTRISGLGTEFEVMQTAIKPYPCCRFNHGLIDGVAEIVSEHGLGPEDIDRIDAYFSPLGYQVVGQPAEAKRDPTGVVDGQFSAHFAAAATAVDGEYTWKSYEKLRDPEVKALMEVTMTHASEEIEGLGCTVLITTGDGRQLRKDKPLAKGEPEKPLTWDEVIAKFNSLARDPLGEAGAQSILGSVRGLELIEDLSSFTRALRSTTAAPV